METSPIAAGPFVATGSRRERKKQETRAALEEAALRLFAERGYEQTTVEDIADAADVAVRTFFRYFSSKQHVLFGDVALDIAQRLRQALHRRPVDEPPAAAIRVALDQLDVEDPERHRQIVARVQLVRQLPELLPSYHMVFQNLHDVIAEFVAARTGLRHTSMYPQLLAGAATLSAKTALCELEHGEVSPQTLRALRERSYDALTVGLAHLAPTVQAR